MMLANDVDHWLGYFIFFCQKNPFFYVVSDQFGTFLGIQIIVNLGGVFIVLCKYLGVDHFSDVVLIAANPRQKGIGPDDFSSPFGQVSHNQAMMIGSNCFRGQFF